MTYQEGLASTSTEPLPAFIRELEANLWTASGGLSPCRSMPFSSFRERGEALSCIDDRPCRFRVPRYAGFRERRVAPFRVRAKRPSPPSGLAPRPRKPSAPCADGHECALRATRNAPRLPSSHESALPLPRSQTALRPCDDLWRLKPFYTVEQIG